MTGDSIVGMGMGRGDLTSVVIGDCVLEMMSGAGLIVGAGALGSRAKDTSSSPSPAITAILPPRMAPHVGWNSLLYQKMLLCDWWEFITSSPGCQLERRKR